MAEATKPQTTTAPANVPAQAENKAIAKADKSMSVRFMEKVVSEFATGVGEIALTGHQQRLVQNYFVAVDMQLKIAEEKRLKKTKNQDPTPVTWANVNMEGLARSVIACARIGLDPAQKNHINMMPFKNNNTDKYDIVFIEGYRGIELKAVKYGMDVPDAVIVELVYTKDLFKAVKKSVKNPVEIYEFDVIDAFDRGEIKGGFYYHAYAKNPERNKLVVMSLKDIMKRKPAYASAEFWGGEKTVWKDGKPAGTEQVDGWFEKMCWKTIYRAAYNDITIDSQKIDSDYLQLKQMEESLTDSKVAAEIAENANADETLRLPESTIDAEFTPEECASNSGTTNGQAAPPTATGPNF